MTRPSVNTQARRAMARLQLAALGVLLLVAFCGPAAATTQSFGDLAATGLPELAAAVVTEVQGTPLEPIVNGVVRAVNDALGVSHSLAAPSPAGAAIFDTSAAPAGAPAGAPAAIAAPIFDTSAPAAAAPAKAPMVAPAPAPAAKAPAVGRAVPVFASPNDAGAVGGRRLLRA
ncbi:hypothetical protein WJX81_008617 [Elliptochloris bilobata]|uniref:Uncharacterized protein n=1 Tax=Elliptochloris bilobata TaxID=381761 RepID=A0AAW1QJX7_9CHLO